MTISNNRDSVATATYPYVDRWKRFYDENNEKKNKKIIATYTKKDERKGNVSMINKQRNEISVTTSITHDLEIEVTFYKILTTLDCVYHCISPIFWRIFREMSAAIKEHLVELRACTCTVRVYVSSRRIRSTVR